MQIQKKNIAVAIILSIVTCGIYSLYWVYCLNEDANKVSQEQNPMGGGMVILLTIVTCGIFGIYWCYKQGEKISRAETMRGLPSSDRAVLYLILALFGFAIIDYALMQDSLNKIADADGGQQNAAQG